MAHLFSMLEALGPPVVMLAPIESRRLARLRELLDEAEARSVVAASRDQVRVAIRDETVDAVLVDDASVSAIGSWEALDDLGGVVPPLIALDGSGDRSPNAPLSRVRPWRVVPSTISDADLASLLTAAAVAGQRRLRAIRIAEEYEGRFARLTAVEREVLRGIVAGKLNKQIAATCGVSVRTVEERRKRVYNRFGVSSSALLCFAAGVAASVDSFSARVR